MTAKINNLINSNLDFPSQNKSILNYNLNKNKKKTAFSLIELSIVLIIIGLLVAGITGGASLIKSAKMRAFMNEVNNYKIAYNAYYAATGKMLGGGNIITFNASRNGYYPTNNPFYDLYEEGITDFKTEETGRCVDDSSARKLSKCGPKINSLGSGIFVFLANKDIKDGLSNNLVADYEFPIKDAENIDKKYDDGIGTSGTIYCSDKTHLNSYDTTIINYNQADSTSCGSLFFTLDI